MALTNVEVVRRALEVYSRGDRATAASLMHPDVEFRTILGPLLGVERVRGRDAVLRFVFEDIPAAFDIGDGPVVEEVTDLAGGKVLLVARYPARGKGSGAEVDVRVASVYSLRDGVVVSVRDYASKQEALDAARLSD